MDTPYMRVKVPAAGVELEGLLDWPAKAIGVVAFAHGSGSGRHSPRNQFVAAHLFKEGLGTLLLDLLTPEEDRDSERRFDIELLSDRLSHAVRFLSVAPATRHQPIGLFGASTGAAAALRVAAAMPQQVKAVVSRGGRPDLAGAAALGRVRAPTLLIVGAADRGVVELNQAARDELVHCACVLRLVPGATHLFEEPGALAAVAQQAASWFHKHLAQHAAAER